MSRIITALDLGSSNIRAAVCRMDGPERLKLLALDSITSKGIDSGNIVDFNAACKDIALIMARVEGKIKRNPKSISLALSGSGVEGITSKGMIGLSRRPRQITQSDIVKCKDVASLVRIPMDRKIIQTEVHSFFINEGDKVENPLGLYATKLSIKIHIITADISKIMNLQNLIEHAGYILDNIIYSGGAIAYSVLDGEERKDAIALIDIGSHLTNITVFEKGYLKYLNCLLKGSAELEDGRLVNSYFQDIKKHLLDFSLSKAVITGGGVLKEDILESAESKLGMRCQLGQVKLNWCSLSPKDAFLHTSTLGLIAYEAKRLTRQPKENHPVTRIIRFFSNIFESYF